MSDKTSRSTSNGSRWLWLPEILELSSHRFWKQTRLYRAALLVGVVAGLGAVVFAASCHVVSHYTLDSLAGYRPSGPQQEVRLETLKDTDTPFRPWMLLILPTLGGLMSGWIVYRYAPEAEGHGTDAVIQAYHEKQGEMRARVPLIKMVASVLTISTGGSGGREGPIAQIGAGFGSTLANMLKMRPAERRILLAAGMGAGIAAIFRAPLAGALFAAEVLYRSPEIEQEVLIPAGLSSVVSYCTFAAFYGWEPLFLMEPLRFTNVLQLGPYLVLAVVMAGLAMCYTRTFYGLTKWFHRWKVPPHVRPAIGALATAILGLSLYYAFQGDQEVLAVMSVGYGILQDSMQNGLRNATGVTAMVLLAVALGKIVTTSLTIGSGGSGGVFGPSMVIGGCAGGAVGLALHHLWPELVPQPTSFMIVGMAGFFAAAAKTPFSTLAIVVEMTADYQLLLPTLWVCSIAYLVSDKQSIYSQQVVNRAMSPAHRGAYVREVLAGLHVGQFLTGTVTVTMVHPHDTLSEALDRLSHTTHAVLPVVDHDRRLVGMLSLEDLNQASQSTSGRPWVLVADLMRTRIVPLRPQDSLDTAAERFAESDLPDLPVVGLDDEIVTGMLHFSDIIKAYLRELHGRGGT